MEPGSKEAENDGSGGDSSVSEQGVSVILDRATARAQAVALGANPQKFDAFDAALNHYMGCCLLLGEIDEYDDRRHDACALHAEAKRAIFHIAGVGYDPALVGPND